MTSRPRRAGGDDTEAAEPAGDALSSDDYIDGDQQRRRPGSCTAAAALNLASPDSPTLASPTRSSSSAARSTSSSTDLEGVRRPRRSPTSTSSSIAGMTGLQLDDQRERRGPARRPGRAARSGSGDREGVDGLLDGLREPRDGHQHGAGRPHRRLTVTFGGWRSRVRDHRPARLARPRPGAAHRAPRRRAPRVLRDRRRRRASSTPGDAVDAFAWERGVTLLRPDRRSRCTPTSVERRARCCPGRSGRPCCGRSTSTRTAR